MKFVTLHKNAKDISGQRFGRLIAAGPVSVVKYPSGANHVHWLCKCDCGNEKVVSVAKLTTGNTRSCGCFQSEARLENKGGLRHGQHGTPEYEAWHALLQRCNNPKDKGYKNYGARGVRVCALWQKFENFYADMGPRPSPLHSIDRRENSGNYERNNCRWATKSEQQRNTRLNRIVTAFGKTAPLVCFFEHGCKEPAYFRAHNRISRGWDAEKAIATPAMRGA